MQFLPFALFIMIYQTAAEDLTPCRVRGLPPLRCWR
jgi:hypothetical protein